MDCLMLESRRRLRRLPMSGSKGWCQDKPNKDVVVKKVTIEKGVKRHDFGSKRFREGHDF